MAVTLTLSLAGPTSQALGAPVPAAGPAAALTNLAHLDFLTAQVEVPPVPGHTSYHLDTEKSVGVLWVYADARPGGAFQRVGGGPHAADGRYAQGAYDADDIARAAVVYLRQWRATGDACRETAGLPATPGPGIPADADRPEGRRGGAVDATER